MVEVIFRLILLFCISDTYFWCLSRYAISAAVHQVQRRREKFSWTQMSQRRDDKFVYIELWKCKVMGLKSGIRPIVKAPRRRAKTSKLEQLYDHSIAADSNGSMRDFTSCYADILAISHARRAPIEAIYHPGDFIIPVGCDVSAVEAALSGGAQAAIGSVQYYAMTEELVSLLKELEERLSFEDISFFRSLAERDLAMEGRAPQTWLGEVSSWIFGSWQTATPADMISDEERRRLYETLHFDPEAVFVASGGGGHADVCNRETNHPSRIIASVSYNINRMGVSLALSAPDATFSSSCGHMTPFLEVEVTDVHVDVTVMGSSVPGATHSVTNFSIGDFEAFEVLHNDASAESSYGYYGKSASSSSCASNKTVGKQYIKLVSRKGKELKRRRQQRERSASTASSRTPAKSFEEINCGRFNSIDEASMSAPLVNICVENDTSMKDFVDVSVNITVEELELFVSPTQKLPQFLQTFFTWPADLEFWSEMEMAAINEIADFQYVLSCKIDYMRRNHMNIDIIGSIKAPVLIVTETIPLKSKGDDDHHDVVDEEGTTGYLIVDLGHISIHTEKMAKAAYEMSLVDHSMKEMSVISGTEVDAPTFSSANSMRSVAVDKNSKVSAAMSQKDIKIVRMGELIKEKGQLPTPLSTKRLVYDEDDNTLPEPPVVFVSDRYDAMMTGSQPDVMSNTARVATKTTAPRPLQSILGEVIDTPKMSEHFEGSHGNNGSEEGPNDRVDDAASASGANNTSTNDPVNKQDSLYDVFKVSITNCSAYMIDSLSELAEPMPLEKFRKCCIMDRYDMNLSIHVSVLQWDKDLPPVKLAVELPSMHFLLSEEKVLRMVSIMNAVTENSKRIVQAQKDVLSKIELAKERMRCSASTSDATSTHAYFVRDGAQMLHRNAQLDLLADYSAPNRRRGSYAVCEEAMSPFCTVDAADDRERVNSDFDEELGLQFYDASPGIRSRATTIDDKDGTNGKFQTTGMASVSYNDQEMTKNSFYRNQSHSSVSRLSKLAGNAAYRQLAFDSESTDLGQGIVGRRVSGSLSKTESARSSKFFSGNLFDDGLNTEFTPPVCDSKYGAFIDSVDVRSEYEGNSEYQHDYDSDASSDDSFQSVMEHEITADEAKELAESVRVMLQQRQVMVAHAMEEMRLMESDIGKKATSRHKRLQAELRQLEGEVQHLRVSYVEALIRADEVKRRGPKVLADSQVYDNNGDSVASVVATVGASTVATLHGSVQEPRRRTMSVGNLPHQEVIDSLSMPSDALRRNLVSKRTLLQNSVFRPLPDSHRRRYVGVRGGVGGNKELVRLSLELATFTVDFLCSKPQLNHFTTTPAGNHGHLTPQSGNSQYDINFTDVSPSVYSPSIYSPYNYSPIDLSANQSSPADFEPALEASLLRMQVSGIKTSMKHKTDDTKIIFSVQEMFVEDMFQSMRSRHRKPAEKALADDGFQRALLVTSDAPYYSTGSSKLPRPRGFSMDAHQLMKLDTKLVYGKETAIGNSSPWVENSSRAFSSYQDEEGPTEQQTVMYPTTAKVNLTLGYLRINIDQNIMAHLCSTVLSISSKLPKPHAEETFKDESFSHVAEAGKTTPLKQRASFRKRTGGSVDLKSEYDSPAKLPAKTVSSTEHERKLFASLVTLKLTTRVVGFSVSVIHKLKPILTAAVWGLSTSVRIYGDESIELKTRVVDINAHYLWYKAAPPVGSGRFSMVASLPDTDIFYQEPIFGRPSDSTAPSIEVSLSGSISPRDNAENPSKVRLSCLIECTPLDVVIVPKAILKLVDSVLSGPLVALFKSLKEPSASVDHDIAYPVGPIFGPLNAALKSFFKKVEGNMNISSSGLSLYILSNYIRSISSSGSVDITGNQLALEIKKISFDCAFGGECEFGGVELCQNVIGISLSIDQQVLVDPFDVSLQVALLQDNGSKNYYFIPDRCNSVFESLWKPIRIDSISDGQILSSAAISPLRINIHEGIIISLHNFADKITDHVKKFKEKKGISRVEDVSIIEDTDPEIKFWQQNLGYSIGLATLIYEVSISLQAVSVFPDLSKRETPRSKPRRKSSKRPHSNGRSTTVSDLSISSWWKDKRNDANIPQPVPIMGLIIKEFRSDVIFRSSSQTATCCEDPSSIFLVKTELRSFDICHLKAPHNAMCRTLVTTIHPDVTRHDILSPTVSIHPSSGFSHYFAQEAPLFLEKTENFVLFSDVRVSSAGDIEATAQLSNVKFVLLTDTLLTFFSLALLYKTSLSDSSTMNSVREMASHLPTETMVGLNQKKSFEDIVASEMAEVVSSEMVQPEAILSTTHPISRPLSMPLDTENGNLSNLSIEEQSKVLIHSRVLRINKNSLALPKGLKSFKICLKTVGCGVFLPGSDNSAEVPGIFASANSQFDIKYVPILQSVNVDDIFQPFEEVNSANCFFEDGLETPYYCWSNDIKFSDVNVCLEAISFPEVFVPIDKNNVPGIAHSSLSYDDNLHHLNEKNESKSDHSEKMFHKRCTVIVKPFSVIIAHNVFVHPLHKSHGFMIREDADATNSDLFGRSGYSELLSDCIVPKLKQKCDIKLHGIEVYSFVDYRPLLRVFKNSFQPLIDIADLVATSVDHRFTPNSVDNSSCSVKEGFSGGNQQRSGLNFSSPRKIRSNVNTPKAALISVQNNVAKNNVTEKNMYVGSIFQLLGHLHEISDCTFTVSLVDFSLTLVNDMYREPVSVFRAVYESINISMLIEKQSVTASVYKSPLGNDLCFEVLAGGYPRSVVPNSHIVSVSCLMKTLIEYQNHTFGAWEPLVEQFEIIVHAKVPVKGRKRFEYPLGVASGIPPVDSVWILRGAEAVDATILNPLNSEINYDSIHANCCADHMVLSPTAAAEIGIRVKVSVPSVVNINVTAGLLDTAQGTVEEIQKIATEMSSDSYRIMEAKNQGGYCTSYPIEEFEELDSPKDISLVTIRNDTGMVLRLWPDFDYSSDAVIEISPEASHPLSLRGYTSETFNAVEYGENSSRHISFSVLKDSSSASGNCLTPVEYPRIKNLELEGDGCRLFLLTSSEEADEGVHLKALGHCALGNVMMAPTLQQLLEPNAVCLVTELKSHRGIRSLLVRSTIYLFNALSTAVRVTLLTPGSSVGRAKTHWSAIVESNAGVSVPAQFCNIPNSGLNLCPIYSPINLNDIFDDSVFFETPVFPGQLGDKIEDNSLLANAKDHMDQNKFSPQSRLLNKIKRNINRQKKTSVSPELLSYSHWIEFTAGHSPQRKGNPCRPLVETAHAVVNVVSSGAPSSYQSKYFDSFLSRTITLLPTVVISNCLAYGVEVALVKDDLGVGCSSELSYKSFEQLPHATVDDTGTSSFGSFSSFLGSGDSISTMTFHSADNLMLCFRMQNASTANSSWSAQVKIPSCSDDSKPDKSVTEAEIVYANGSSLYISVEIGNVNGVREVSLFVPYWLIAASEFPIVYQHDTSDKNVSEKRLNGSDDLCADQFYFDNEHISNRKPENMSCSSVIGGRGIQDNKFAFKLGPEESSGGLLDALNLRGGARVKKTSGRTLKPNQAIWNSVQSHEVDNISNVDVEASYKLVQFSHSRAEVENDVSRSGHVRLSVNGSSWSRSVNLDRLGTTNVEVFSEKSKFRSWLLSVRKRAASRLNLEREDYLSENIKEIVSYNDLEAEATEQHRAFSFGMTTTAAEFPFHRTKLVLVVDQFVLLNNTGQPLQVMQSDSNTVTSVSTLGSLALSWHAYNPKIIQLRLDKIGWKWSGGFDPTKEGDTSLRLRNEHDSAVYFILVHVVKKGPRVFIALKGGEKMATYRIENHTIRKIRLQQLGVENVSTTLLQYHTCMYSWDEPLKEQKFKLDIDVSDNSARWVTMGIYSFDRLMTYPRVGDFSIRVVAMGPLRVLQIYPASNIKSEYKDHTMDLEGADRMIVNRDVHHQMALTDTALSVHLHMADVGISIIDRSPEELLYVSISEVAMTHEIVPGLDFLQLSVGAVHVDNQLLSTPFPSMFSPVSSLINFQKPKLYSQVTPIGNDSESALMSFSAVKDFQDLGDNDCHSVTSWNHHNSENPFILLTVQRDFSYQGISFFPLIKLDIKPFDINVESAIIGKLIAAVSSLVKANIERERQQREHPVLARMGLLLSSRDRSAALYPISIISSRRMKCVRLRDSIGSDPINRHRPLSSQFLESGVRKRQYHSLHRFGFGDMGSWRPEFLLSFITQKALRELSPPADEVMKSTSKIYIARLELSSVSMNLSFNPGIFQGTNVDDNTLGMKILAGLLHGVGSTMAVDNVPLTFRKIELDHLYGTAFSVGKAISNKYTVQAVVQGLLVMLSLEAIGNPVHLVKTIWEGVYDFVSYPLQGMIKSPVEFLNGLMKGSESLMFRLVSTAANTINRVANNTRNVMLVLRLVSNSNAYYLSDISDNPTEVLDRPVSAKTATDQMHSRHLVLGASNVTPAYLPTNVLQGLVKGLSGVLKFPYHGFKRGGFKGMLFGLIRGSFELLTKPIFGWLTGISFLMSKCQTWFSYRINLGHRRRLQRIRPPRIFEPTDSPLNCYQAEEYIGTELLSRTCNGMYRSERYICHYTLCAGSSFNGECGEMASELLVLLTERRLLVVGGGTTDYCELKWTCPVANIACLSRGSTNADTLHMMYSMTIPQVCSSPLSSEDESKLLSTSFRFTSGSNCSGFVSRMFSIRPELRTALFAGLFAAKWNKSQRALADSS